MALIAVVAVAIVAIAAAVVLMNNGGDKPSGPSQPDTPVDTYYPVTVDSSAQSKTFSQTFDKAPERIVCIYSANVELMCLFGLQDKVVKAYTGNNRDYVCVNPSMQAAYDKIPKFSGDMTPELVRADEADLILGWSSTFGDNYLGWVDTWNGYGTKCYSTNRPAATVQDYVDMVNDIGVIFNKKDVAKRIVDEFTAVYSDVSKKVASIGEANRTTALVVEPGYEGAMFVYGSKFLTGDLVTVAGGKNLFDGAMEKLTFEQIASYSPDVIFVMAKGMTEQNKKDAVQQLNDVPGLKSFVAQADKVVPYGFYEIYDGGVLPSDIVQRMYNDMYGGSQTDSYYPVTVTTTIDGKKVEQTVTKEPERVLIWQSGTAELMCYLGLQDKIIGVYTDIEPNYVCTVPELQSKYNSVPKIDRRTLSVEGAIGLQPDVILGWASTFRDTYLGSHESWNDRGAACFVTNRPSDTVDDYLGILEMIGKVFNKQDETDSLIKQFTSVYSEVEKKTSKLSDDEKVKALILEVDTNGVDYVYGSKFLTGDIITVCGGINLCDGAMEHLDPEYLASLTPDKIIIGANQITKEEALQKFITNPAYASMTRNIAVYPWTSIYMGGFLPPDLLSNVYNDLYGESSGDYYPVTVSTVMTGSKISQTVPKEPERVLVWQSSTVELLCYFGLQDKIVGEYTELSPVRQCIVPELQSIYNKVPKIDRFTFSVEEAIALNPDVILGWESTFTDSYLGSCESWNARGTSCFVANKPNNCVDDYLGTLRMIGQIFNMEDKAQELIEEFTSVYSEVESKTAGLSDSQKVKALMVNPASDGRYQLYGAQTLSGDMITVCGGINAFSGGQEWVSPELIASLDPDLIILMANGVSEDVAAARFNDNPAFASMTDNRVVYQYLHLYPGGFLPPDILDRIFNEMYGIKTLPDSEYYPVTVNTVMNGGFADQTVTKKPERILVWESSTVELLCYFGLGDKVVGEYTVAEPKRVCILPELQAAYDAVPKLDKSTFSVEQAVGLNPDAILGWESTFTDSYLGTYDKWNARGTSCFVTNRPANCVDDYIGILEMIGKIFNMEELAKEKIDEFTSVYAEVEKKTSGLSDAEKRKVMMILPSSGDKYQLYGSSFLSGDMINVCGGINVYDGWRDWLEPEYIASLNPDLIIIMADNVSQDVAASRFNNNPAFASMTKNRVVYDYLDLYPGGFLPPDILNRLFVEMYGS